MSPPAELSAVVPSATVAQLLESSDARVVDLRSPSEFAVDHVPGAHSVPLFDDVERAVIGTLYKQASRDAAFEVGRVQAARRIDSLVERVAEIAKWELPAGDLSARVQRATSDGIDALEGGLEPQPLAALPGRALVLHCWRGGLRSRSVAALLRAIGLERVVLLEGGYQSWRTHVRKRLETWSGPGAFVLRGLTGVGKTLVLRELEKLRPGWTVDLEGLAGHRSSILGMVGLEPVPQKTFETRMFERLVMQGFPEGAPVVYEGESRKVGDAILPPSVWESLCGGTNILLTASLERRVRVLMDDYLEHAENRAPLRAQLPFIENRLGSKAFDGVLTGLLDAGRDAELVELLLERYYDPLYRHSEKGRTHLATIDTGNPAQAAAEVARAIESLPG